MVIISPSCIVSFVLSFVLEVSYSNRVNWRQSKTHILPYIYISYFFLYFIIQDFTGRMKSSSVYKMMPPIVQRGNFICSEAGEKS